MKKLLLFIILLTLMGLTITIDAQPQFFKVRIENVGQPFPFIHSGAFAVPVDSMNPGPLHPGEAYEFTFEAAPGHRLSFATMFVQSNDIFVGPDEMGISMYDESGNPVSGDLTSNLVYWDAGTEFNEAPGEGMDQAPRQSGANTGMVDPDSTVRILNDTFSYPSLEETILFTIQSNGGTSFTARFENISTDSALLITDGSPAPVLYAPGVYVVHTDPAPLFTSGEKDRGEGLEDIAEDGDPGDLMGALDMQTGATAVLAPGVFVVHGEDNPLFISGSSDLGMGLEDIAEDGNPGRLALYLRDHPMMTGGAFAIPVGKDMPGPAFPGDAYEFTIASGPDGRLSLATMYVQSNDLFYAPDASGIALFENGEPISGDITALFELWDAGTEANEFPGAGVNQAPRQSGPNTGMVDADPTVRLVNDAFDYPANDQVLKVTVMPLTSHPFSVQIENVSDASTLPISDSESVPVPLAPGVWAIHTTPSPLFANLELDRGLGLEDIAEDGNPELLGDWLAGKMGTPSGVFNTPAGTEIPAPIFPGEQYTFSFTAAPGANLSLATMFVQSNDLFYAPDESGIPLFDNLGNPISGDITAWFDLWDSGTELNEQPGVGENQAPRQSEANTGVHDTDSLVRLVNDAFAYPEDEAVIRVTISTGNSTAVTPLADKLGLGLSVQPYPNPFTDEVTIRLQTKQAIEVAVDVYSLDGRKLDQIAPQQSISAFQEYTWNPDRDLAEGVYFVRVYNRRGTLGSSLVIKKN